MSDTSQIKNKCDVCGADMEVIYTREDGCRYWQCTECENSYGEETEEWFNKMEKIAPGNIFKVNKK